MKTSQKKLTAHSWILEVPDRVFLLQKFSGCHSVAAGHNRYSFFHQKFTSAVHANGWDTTSRLDKGERFSRRSLQKNLMLEVPALCWHCVVTIYIPSIKFLGRFHLENCWWGLHAWCRGNAWSPRDQFCLNRNTFSCYHHLHNAKLFIVKKKQSLDENWKN